MTIAGMLANNPNDINHSGDWQWLAGRHRFPNDTAHHMIPVEFLPLITADGLLQRLDTVRKWKYICRPCSEMMLRK